MSLVIHHEHQGDGSARRGLTRGECCRLPHVHGGHGRVVPYDPDCCVGTATPPSFRRGVYYPSLKLGGALRRPVLLIHSLAPRRPLTVSSRGRVFGFLPLNIRHKFPAVSRSRSVDLREKAFKLILRRARHLCQDLIEPPHHHVSALSELNFRAPKDGRSSEGWRYQKTIKRCPK